MSRADDEENSIVGRSNGAIDVLEDVLVLTTALVSTYSGHAMGPFLADSTV
jgi:hypothetical protein